MVFYKRLRATGRVNPLCNFEGKIGSHTVFACDNVQGIKFSQAPINFLSCPEAETKSTQRDLGGRGFGTRVVGQWGSRLWGLIIRLRENRRKPRVWRPRVRDPDSGSRSNFGATPPLITTGKLQGGSFSVFNWLWVLPTEIIDCHEQMSKITNWVNYML